MGCELMHKNMEEAFLFFRIEHQNAEAIPISAFTMKAGYMSQVCGILAY